MSVNFQFISCFVGSGLFELADLVAFVSCAITKTCVEAAVQIVSIYMCHMKMEL